MPDASSPPAQPHLYLVDGSSYIFRAYHRLPPLTNRHGVPAGAVYGYTAMLWKLADGLNKADGPTPIAVILDASSNTHRNIRRRRLVSTSTDSTTSSPRASAVTT